MSVWNVFDPDAFSLHSLTAAINQVPFTPMLLSQLGIFDEQGIPTTTALIEENNGVLALVEVAPRNAPGQVVNADKRKVRNFSIPHLPSRASIMADEVQGVREFGSEGNARTIESARTARLIKMRRQLDYTLESHRLSVIKGTYIDVNGTATNLYTAFNVTQDTVDFALNSTGTKVRSKCLTTLGHIEQGLGGINFTGVHALCGATFFDNLITHTNVEATYLNQVGASELRGDPRQILNFGGIVFERYRGTSAVQIDDKEAYAFPMGVPELFLTRFAPANYLETVNTIGLPYYAKSKVMDFDKGLDLEAQSNPLNLCTRPAAVVKLTTP